MAVISSGYKQVKKCISFFLSRRNVLNLLLYLYVAILLLCNAARAFDHVFWFDEVYSINMSKMTFSEMIAITAADVHPPLYYMLLQVCYRLFGGFGEVYHAASVLTYAILLFVSVIWLKRKFGLGATTLFITFASFLYNAMEYNLEVRMYSMAELFVLLSFFMLYLIFTEQKIRWYALFALFSLAAAYTHYYALLSVAFFYVALLLFTLYKKMRGTLWKVLATYLVTVLGYLPWLFTFLETWKRTTDSWWLQSVPSWKQCIEFLFSGKLSNVLWIVLVIVLILFFVEKIYSFQITKQEKNSWNFTVNRVVGPLVDEEMAWVFAGVLAIVGTMTVGKAASAILRPVFQVKYLFPVSVVAWLLLAVGCSKLKFRKTWLAALIFIMAFTGAIQFRTFYLFEESLDLSTRETLEVVSDLGEDPYILYNSGYMLDYYYPDIRLKHFGTLPEWQEYADQNVWLFWSTAIDNDVLEELAAEGTELDLIREGYLGVSYTYIYHKVDN